jgi:hypothetical protein
VDPEQPEAQGVAVVGDRIAEVGSNAEVKAWEGSDTRMVDLSGRTVLPGFIDAHTHYASTGVRMRELDFWDCTSMAELLKAVALATRTTPPGEWILGRNWDETRWPEKRYPNQGDLDAVAPRHPVALSRVDYHMVSVNSKALDAIAVPPATPGLIVDLQGRPTGELKEQAAEVLWAALEPTAEVVEGRLAAVTAEAHRLGITSVHDTVNDREIRAYLGAKAKGHLEMRVYLMPREAQAGQLLQAGLATGLGDQWLKLGPIKLFSDGSFGSRTAALHEDFADDPGNRGMLIHGEAEFSDLVARLHSGGFQLAVHSIGDRAIDHVLDVLASALAKVPRRDHRHRIEHFELPTEDGYRKARDLGVVASMQPNFVGRLSAPGGMMEARLGKRYLRNNPFRRVLEFGIPLAFGSDHMPFGPLYGIHCAVNAPVEDQRMEVEEAVRAYTLGGAFAAHEEAIKGSLTRGKLADLVVLGSDPRERPEAISHIPVEMTVLGGRIVFKG